MDGGGSMLVLTSLAARLRLALVALPLLAACTPIPAQQVVVAGPQVSPVVRAMYGPVDDGAFVVPAIPERHLTPENVRQVADYWTDEPAGSIVVDPYATYLYYVLGNARAIRYRIGVGEAGRNFAGRATIPYKLKWPGWMPTANMIREDPDLYGPHRGGMTGGLQNPLGSRALYLFQGGRDTTYRIHGTYAPWSIGVAVSAGCIRMFNRDAMDLYERVEPGTRVLVLAPHETGRGTVPPALAWRG